MNKTDRKRNARLRLQMDDRKRHHVAVLMRKLKLARRAKGISKMYNT